MRILLATYYLCDRTGSELFTADLARSLAARGHDIHIYSPLVGVLAQQLADEGMEVTGCLSDLSDAELDIAHVHHNVVAVAVRAAFPDLPMLMLLHGVLPELEQPPSVELGIARLLCVSEEVMEHARQRGTFGAPTEVVRNFVNGDHWLPAQPAGSTLRRVLVLANDYPPAMRQMVEAACSLVGADVHHVGLPENPQEDVRSDIAWADLVITLGRGAIEAMAMERNVLILGSAGADGIVDKRSFFEFRKKNFSGRTRRIEFTPESLAQELRRYDPGLGPPLRNLVLAENGEIETIRRLENIYREAICPQIASRQYIPLLPEFSFLYNEVVHRGDYWHLRDRYALLQTNLRRNEAEMAAVHASTSWRLTAPVRWIGSLLHRDRRRAER